VKNHLTNLALIIASFMFAFLLAEGAARLRHRQFAFENFVAEKRSLIESAYPTAYDEYLGWVPKAGTDGTANLWHTQVTVLENGLRSNGEEPVGKGLILTVGDSFTFGDQVSDNDTWPAVLAHTLGRPVLNGGVFGYGIDQIWLRADQLMKVYHPAVLVFSFIPDDIERCELSMRSGVSKPYYRPVGDDLVLENVPVPRPFHLTAHGRLQRIVGYSYLVHRVMMRFAPDFWLRGSGGQNLRAHAAGVEVACRLLGRLGERAAQYGVERVVVLVQYEEDISADEVAKVERVLSCVDTTRVSIVDLRGPLEEVRQAGRLGELFNGHMTPVGNRWVAQRLRPVVAGSER